jgi:hypothetical protein
VLRLAERDRARAPWKRGQSRAFDLAILCLGNRSFRLDGYGFIGELA